MSGDASVFSLTDNPFAQTGLTPRASREQVAERAGRSAWAAQALLDPFQRLTEELSWLPGASGQAAAETVQALAARNPNLVGERLVLLRGLAKANLAADAAVRFADPDLVEQMVRAWDAVEVDDVAGQVNADRMISGFPQVNAAQVGWALQAVRERHGGSAAQLLARVEDGRERLERLIERPAPSGQDADLRLVDSLVSAWAEAWAPALDKTEASILNEVDAMTRGGRDGTDRLEMLLEGWKAAYAPALLLARRRGREDARALNLVGDIRGLYLDPSAGEGRLAPAARIAALLGQAFPDAPAIQRMTAGDVQRLGVQTIPTPDRPPPPPPAAKPARDRAESRAETKAERDRRHAGVKARDAARAAANAEEAARRLAQQQRDRAAAEARQPWDRKPAPAMAAQRPSGSSAEAAREALIAQVRARVEAQGQTPVPSTPQKKKGGCGWIIPLIIGGFMLVRCINEEIEKTPVGPSPRTPPAEAPLVPAPDARDSDMPVDPPTFGDPDPAPKGRRQSPRATDNQIGSGAPEDGQAAEDGSVGGGSRRR